MKNIIVTGASGGMGVATCKLFLEKGYNVYALDFKELDIPKSKFIKIDVTDIESIEKAYDKIKNEVDSIDAIIHFAGIYNLDSLIEINEIDFMKIFDINLFGVYRINKIFMPLLKKNSKIVITSSELAPLDPLPFTGLYAITKSAIEKYAYSLRMEVQLLGIKVSVIRPGAIDTGLLDVSTKALNVFCDKTELYKCNAKRFKNIVDSVESKKVSSNKIASLAMKIMLSKNPKYVYNINRNFLLKLLNALPKRLQNYIIRKILK